MFTNNFEIAFFGMCGLTIGFGFMVSSRWFTQISKNLTTYYYAARLFFIHGSAGFKSFVAYCDKIEKLNAPIDESIDRQAEVVKLLNEAQDKTIDVIHMANSINHMKIHGVSKMEVVSVITKQLQTMPDYERKRIINATDCFSDGEKLHFICDEKRVVH